MARSIQRFANPAQFMALSGAVLPWASAAAALTLGVGLYFALLASPPDYQQGETVRMMYVHVPAAWLASAGYASMALACAIGLIWRHPLAFASAKAMAPLGAAFTFLALVTGALWGKPMWGAYWVWDARLTSVLVLFFIYLGYMALWEVIEDFPRAAKATSVFCLAGAANLPVIRFSVDWWNTQHQPASVVRLDGPAIHASILTPLLIMAVGFTLLFVVLTLVRTRTEILQRRAAALEAARVTGRG
jgi:heme exporter protein C